VSIESKPSAYFLISHGSRDPRPYQALDACATLVRQILLLRQSVGGWPMVGIGVLEFGQQPLAVQIATFAQRVARHGIQKIFLIPLFLSAGNHVNQDIPTAIGQAADQLPKNVFLHLCAPLGTHAQMKMLVQQRMADNACDHWILLAHGTRRTDGNQVVEALATQLQALPAYWSIQPNLEAQLQTLDSLTQQRVGIMPYFLFTGSIIDTIRTTANQLQLQLTHLELFITQPLNPSPLMAQMLLDCCTTVATLSP
jgi:sirohydrochlorin cobaltochelatase